MFLANQFRIIALAIAVLVITPLLIIVGGASVGALSSFGNDKESAQPAPVPRLSQEMRSQLNTALAPEFPIQFDTAGNPFTDRTGVSAGKNSGSPVVSENRVGEITGRFPGMVRNQSGQIPPVIQNIGRSVNQLPGNSLSQLQIQNTPPVPVIKTEDLLRERKRDQRLGKKVEPSSSLYSIDELRPYGIVGTEQKNRVKLFAASTKDRFSVSRGTRFRDGVIEAISNEGVQFRKDNGQTVFVRWLKNTKSGDDDSTASLPRLP